MNKTQCEGLQVTMAVKEAKQKQDGEVGVLPMPDSKALRNWWLVFGASCLLTFGTRLYKVNNLSTVVPIICYCSTPGQ